MTFTANARCPIVPAERVSDLFSSFSCCRWQRATGADGQVKHHSGCHLSLALLISGSMYRSSQPQTLQRR